jgi:hypothetical protein
LFSCSTTSESNTTSAAFGPAGFAPSSPRSPGRYSRGGDIDVERPLVVIAAHLDALADGRTGERAGERERGGFAGGDIELRAIDPVGDGLVAELLSADQRHAERQLVVDRILHHLQRWAVGIHGGAKVFELETLQTRAGGGEHGAIETGLDDHVRARRSDYWRSGSGRWHRGRRWRIWLRGGCDRLAGGRRGCRRLDILVRCRAGPVEALHHHLLVEQQDEH